MEGAEPEGCCSTRRGRIKRKEARELVAILPPKEAGGSCAQNGPGTDEQSRPEEGRPRDFGNSGLSTGYLIQASVDLYQELLAEAVVGRFLGQRFRLFEQYPARLEVTPVAELAALSEEGQRFGRFGVDHWGC